MRKGFFDLPDRQFEAPVQHKPLALQTETLKNFDGGWNVVANDLNLDPKFSKVLRNMYRAPDGTISVRHGTRLFADISTVGGGNIVNAEYYLTRIICVDVNGLVFSIDASGTVQTIFNTTLARALFGSPRAWSATSFVSFCASNGFLVICNGVDKPLLVNAVYSVQYLQDLATGTNVNVPRAKYCLQHKAYLILAGDAVNPSTIYIGAVNATGVFFGDAPPNDAVNVDLGPYVLRGDRTIKGMSRYRDKLIVTFTETALSITLGTYTGTPAVHVPNVDDAIDLYGSISHRANQTIGEEVILADGVGLATLQKIIFLNILKPQRASQLVDPEIQKSYAGLDVAAIENGVFSVYDRLEGMYMLFVPNASTGTPVTETKCYAYSYNQELNVKHWAEFRGWNWSCALRSAEGRIFFGQGSKIFIRGNRQDQINLDYVGDQETFSDGTVFTDGTGFGPVASATDSGIPIAFDWQLPWYDMHQRLSSKATRYISVDSSGTTVFNLDTFIDNFLSNPSDLGESFSDGTFCKDGFGVATVDPVYTPALEMQFAGGDLLGFGGDSFGSGPFGGDRPSRTERLYAWPVKGKLFKIRIFGDSTGGLKIASIAFGYLKGSIRRS